MAKKWQSSPHTIADIREWNGNGTLLLQPDYQRREVWGDAARVMLIDSILNDIPMPKIFVSKAIKDMRTYRSVIDGQQRITTILSFLNDGFALEEPYRGPHVGKKFSELSENIRDDILLYSIDFNEASGLAPEELREVYARVNKYLVPLNRQELRKADFPGEFLRVTEELANLDALDDMGLFNATARRRSLDVEYVSELLAAQLKGISDKKNAIDECCRDYSTWPSIESAAARAEFESAIADISNIFDSTYPMKKTRWKQKADFYSFFFAVLSLRRSGFVLPADVSLLRQDLTLLDARIAPTSEVPVLSRYAVYCVSQANSASSRNWRMALIRAILRGTYAAAMDDEEQRKIVSGTATDLRFAIDPTFNGDGCPPAAGFVCGGCDGFDEGETSLGSSVLYWPTGSTVFQLSNSKWAHARCESRIDAAVVINGASIPGAVEDDYDLDDAEYAE
ncbi:hypothetical protein OX90_14380 [Pseudomonas coronafaciens pv. porri]|uniref:GmrSD restriction endonucleases N-terminal domain-containing protein n=1 Tax=Pseudomonas coronafaciens pv. porri TaxID=83964 RepID=A0ABR5JN03_9PSED|nr:DUF262 domain-containing protein [Pseudomonas coronafaciens]KOP58669.1 hypothetical protein OX90_14380 [Pseudomonas coronafaciens pv. porri]RMP27287.1 hypothetical protein ALQ25_200161 [Pseudomonas coronafaciens pv. atropurpurea]RMU84955.1 hypothetical protein ALP22_00939 [Pseudomonas coronafaciens pv. porri]